MFNYAPLISSFVFFCSACLFVSLVLSLLLLLFLLTFLLMLLPNGPELLCVFIPLPFIILLPLPFLFFSLPPLLILLSSSAAHPSGSWAVVTGCPLAFMISRRIPKYSSKYWSFWAVIRVP